MVESDYWRSLEFRVAREFAGMPQNDLRYFWCDGFVPLNYHLDLPSPYTTGMAWICNGQEQEEWQFTLFLNHPVRTASDIEWRALLPPKNVTRWLAVDRSRRRIEIEPLAAVADAP
jgi:hypothetical protein